MASVTADEKATMPPLTSQPSQHSTSSLDEKNAHSLGNSDSTVEVAKESEGVDVTAGLMFGHAEDEELSPEVARKIRNKLDWNILPLLFMLYTLQFLDKNSIASSNILGILVDAHLTADDFNNLSTAFYIGYIIFVLPHAWMMQRFPIAKYIAFNIFLWSVFLGLQCLAKNYSAMFGLRFLLGASEGCITTGLLTLISMFYTRVEITERIGWTFQCNGLAQIIAGFIAFGLAHEKPGKHPHAWQWFMIVVCLLSVWTSAMYFWRMPDNPTSARFLNQDEKLACIQRIRVNQNGIETKKWKRYQFIEALTDYRVWLFALYAAVGDLIGGIGVEYGAVIKALGYTVEQSTLLNIPSGFAMIIGVTGAGLFLRRFPNGRTIIGAIGFLPAIVGCFVSIFLPLSKRIGFIVCIYLINVSTIGFVMMLSMVALSFSGHTKKMTANAIFFIGYSVGQMLNTQFWKIQYRPRNTVPWIIVLCAFCFGVGVTLTFRYIFTMENKRRDAERAASGKEYDEFGYIEHVDEATGVARKIKVPVQFLDITDKENRAFRYPL